MHSWHRPWRTRNGQVIQSTSDEAPGLLAYVEHYLEAHHSPDLFHVQHELSKAVSSADGDQRAGRPQGCRRSKGTARAHPNASAKRGDEPEKRGPGRPPKVPVSLEHAEHML